MTALVRRDLDRAGPRRSAADQWAFRGSDAQPVDAVWYFTRHEPDAGFVEMIKITPQVTACRLTIQLRATATGCEADVTYRHTSLGPAGDDFVAGFTADYYAQFMQDWEARINHYLAHGEALIGT